ncbi:MULTISPECIES: glutathione S-transferase, partial [Brucella]
MLKIWGRTNSTNVKKALWAAQELNLEYEQIDLGGQFGGLNDPVYLARNPNGLVPLLEDGETILWESNVIVRYLAAAYGKDSLWIENPAKRAQAEKWMDWVSTTIAGDFRDVM